MRLFKKDNSAPPPDPNIGKASLRQAELGENYLKLMERQFEESKPRQDRMDALSEQTAAQQMRIADASEARASENFQRYKERFVPIEDKFLAEAEAAGGATDQQRAADQAVAGLRAQTAIERGITDRNLASMGVNPNSGKFSGVSRANELNAAAATAGAANNAREVARTYGISMRASASNLGRGMMADTTAAGTLALQGGSGALGSKMAGNSYLLARQGTLQSGFQGAMAGNAGMAQGLGNLYNAQVNEAIGKNNAEAQGMAAIGQLAMAGGIAF